MLLEFIIIIDVIVFKAKLVNQLDYLLSASSAGHSPLFFILFHHLSPSVVRSFHFHFSPFYFFFAHPPVHQCVCCSQLNRLVHRLMKCGWRPVTQKPVIKKFLCWFFIKHLTLFCCFYFNGERWRCCLKLVTG